MNRITKAVFIVTATGERHFADVDILTDDIERERRRIARQYRAENVCLTYEEEP